MRLLAFALLPFALPVSAIWSVEGFTSLDACLDKAAGKDASSPYAEGDDGHKQYGKCHSLSGQKQDIMGLYAEFGDDTKFEIWDNDSCDGHSQMSNVKTKSGKCQNITPDFLEKPVKSWKLSSA